MKIQVLSQSFYPDHSGIALYASDFSFYAAQKGHQVEVITGFSFYPNWKKSKKDSRKIFSTEHIGGVKILRGYIYVPEKPTTFKRVIHEISLLASSFINFCRASKPDLIVVFTTPILLGFLGAIFKKLNKSKLVINVQDFQLEAASSLDMTNKKFLFSILSSVENVSYKGANLVTSISHSMFNILKDTKQLEEKKIYLWPNWIQKKDYELDNCEKGLFRKKYNIEEDVKIIAYAGNVGLKQGLETLIELADRYKQNSGIKFFIIGAGSALDNIINYADEKGIKNVSFLSLLNSTEYIHFLNDLDIFFLPQKKTELDVYFPSKLLGLMAAGKIILLSADEDSELYKTVKTNNIGFVTTYGDVDRLKERVDDIFYGTSKRSEEIMSNAQRFVAQFERELVLNRVLEKLSNL